MTNEVKSINQIPEHLFNMVDTNAVMSIWYGYAIGAISSGATIQKAAKCFAKHFLPFKKEFDKTDFFKLQRLSIQNFLWFGYAFARREEGFTIKESFEYFISWLGGDYDEHSEASYQRNYTNAQAHYFDYRRATMDIDNIDEDVLKEWSAKLVDTFHQLDKMYSE